MNLWKPLALVSMATSVLTVGVGVMNARPSEAPARPLGLTLDATSGQNGDTIDLTIDVLSPSSTGMELVEIVSTLGNDANAQYFVVTN